MDTGTMHLTDEEKGMLRGERGEAVKEALAYQIAVGNFFEAEKFVPVANAHVMADIELIGDGGLEFLQRLKALGASCVVDTTTNARCMDMQCAASLGQDSEEMDKEEEIMRLLEELRMIRIDSCINYQTYYQPTLGEHLAWGDTGTVIAANSIFGARTNFESGNASLSAAITGARPPMVFTWTPADAALLRYAWKPKCGMWRTGGRWASWWATPIRTTSPCRFSKACGGVPRRTISSIWAAPWRATVPWPCTIWSASRLRPAAVKKPSAAGSRKRA